MKLANHEPNLNRRGEDRRGTAAVEFAMTAPILFLFLFASLEFSRYIMIQQTANNAAFEAARTCILPGAVATSTDSSVLTGQSAGLNILNAVGINSGTVTIYDATGTSTSTLTGSLTMNTQKVTATVQVPLSKNLWVNPLFLGSGTITKSCTMTCDWVNSTGG